MRVARGFISFFSLSSEVPFPFPLPLAFAFAKVAGADLRALLTGFVSFLSLSLLFVSSSLSSFFLRCRRGGGFVSSLISVVVGAAGKRGCSGGSGWSMREREGGELFERVCECECECEDREWE